MVSFAPIFPSRRVAVMVALLSCISLCYSGSLQVSTFSVACSCMYLILHNVLSLTQSDFMSFAGLQNSSAQTGYLSSLCITCP